MLGTSLVVGRARPLSVSLEACHPVGLHRKLSSWAEWRRQPNGVEGARGYG